MVYSTLDNSFYVFGSLNFGNMMASIFDNKKVKSLVEGYGF